MADGTGDPERCARCRNWLVWSRAGESWCEVCCDDGEDYAQNDATCPRCGNYRPHGCLCHIPIPKKYTCEDMGRAWDQGYASGLSNAMRRMSDEADAPTTLNPYRGDEAKR